MSLLSGVNEGFSKALVNYAKRVHQLAEPLTDAQFWTKPYSYGNSMGHLVLHLTGNLNNYIGAQIARTGYVRDRPREFGETAERPKTEVLATFDETIAMVLATLEQQTEETWGEPYGAEHIQPHLETRFDIVLNCATHLQHHVGQMIYLQRELLRS